MAKPIQFIKDVKNEMKKVVWPSKEQTLKMTVYVILISLFVAIILGAADYGLTELIANYVLER